MRDHCFVIEGLTLRRIRRRTADATFGASTYTAVRTSLSERQVPGRHAGPNGRRPRRPLLSC